MRLHVGVSKPVLSALEGRDQGLCLLQLHGQKLITVETPRLIREDKEHHTHFLRVQWALIQSNKSKKHSPFYLRICLLVLCLETNNRKIISLEKQKREGELAISLLKSPGEYLQKLWLCNFVSWSCLPLYDPSEHPVFIYSAGPHHLDVPTHHASGKRFPRPWSVKHNCLSYARTKRWSAEPFKSK